MPPTFKHFSHDHLLYIEFREFNLFTLCGMCNRFTGRRSIYCCTEHDGYEIHKACGDFPQHMNDHQLHIPRHRLTLVINKNNNSFISTNTCCYYCDLPFQKDEPLYYKCDRCHDFYMHPTCANIPLPIITTSGASDDKDHELVRYVCHEKPMALLQAMEHDRSSWKHQAREEKCFACRSFWSDLPAYYCVTKTCNNFLHKSCGESLSRRIQHPFHLQHPLTLQVSKPRSCDVCWKKDCRLVFKCVEDGCNNINLCTKCAFLEKNINCQSHDHSLSLVEINFSSPNARGIQCDACQKEYKKCSEVDATKAYLFRCMECDFYFHFLCGPLPVHLKYECHVHPLTLIDHSVTKDNSDEYYCDVCEKERDPQYRLYYCASCKYNAHIHCLFQEIMNMINGDIENMELCALGENRWNRFHNTKKNARPRGIKELTLRDLMDSLTEREKKILTNPFGMNDGKIQSFITKYNSHIEREGSIEDVDWVKQLFQFGFDDFKFLKFQLRAIQNSRGLKVDEKYLRQEIIDVNGYMVPKTLAPILRTLLAKHGDLHVHGKPSLTNTMQSVTATILCGVIHRMCRANFEDATLDVLGQCYSDLYGVTCIAGFKQIIDEDSFMKLLLYAFPGLKAIKLEKDLSEKLQLGIEELEAKLKVYKENQLKLEKYESEASNFMKQSMREAAKLKGKKVGDLWFPY